MNILIVDDEQPARQRLVALLQELGHDMDEAPVLREANNGEQALALVKAWPADLILLDIRMPVMHGLEAARHIGKLANPPAIIFTTAYEQHALAAFEANAIDYLLKPVRRGRLAQAINKAAALSARQLRGLGQAGGDVQARKNLSIITPSGIELIPVGQILCFRAAQKYVSAFLPGRELITDETLKKLEGEFAGQFLRIHRNALVARRFIESLGRDEQGNHIIRLEGLAWPLAVSRRQLPVVRARLRSL